MTLSEKKELLRAVQRQKKRANSGSTDSECFERSQFTLAEEAIERLEKPRSRKLMRLRYLEGYSAEAAAEQMEMSTRQVIRISNAAVEELKL